MNQDHVQALFQRGFTFRFTHYANGRPEDQRVACERVSIDSGQSDISVFGDSKESALKAAAARVAEMIPSASPGSQRDIITRQARELEELRAKVSGEAESDNTETDENNEYAMAAAGDRTKEELVSIIETAGLKVDKRKGREHLAEIAFEADLI